MTDDTPTPRDDVLRVLAGAEGATGLADIAAELRMTTKEDRAELASVLHRLKTEGAVTAERAHEKGRRFRYRIAEGAENQLPPSRPQKAARRGVSSSRPQAPREPLHAACEAMETALAAMVKDPAVMAAVRAYGALREAIARCKQ